MLPTIIARSQSLKRLLRNKSLSSLPLCCSKFTERGIEIGPLNAQEMRLAKRHDPVMKESKGSSRRQPGPISHNISSRMSKMQAGRRTSYTSATRVRKTRWKAEKTSESRETRGKERGEAVIKMQVIS